jgi:glutathione peroxidase
VPVRGKVLLVVNTASYCGFTPQYEGAGEAACQVQGPGPGRPGIPVNDFAQEKGSNKEIADFCENTFGVKFPMFGMSSVRGGDANPLYRQLNAQTGRNRSGISQVPDRPRREKSSRTTAA